jgi:hypothetical protein
MTQDGLFDASDKDLARASIELRWNNGPFTDGGFSISITVGDRPVASVWHTGNFDEQDFAEVCHGMLRELNRLVIGHRVTNSHIRRGRVVFRSLDETDIE